jgi:hypothetical protein
MAGRIRRLLRTVPVGRVDLGDLPRLAAGDRVASGGGLRPAAALARGLLAERLAGVAPARCAVFGPGRLVSAATMPFACRLEPLPAEDAPVLEPGELDWLVVGDALAALDDPPAALGRIAAAASGPRAPRLLVVLPGTALLPDDEPPCPRRWLFSPVSGAALARRVFADRAAPVTALGNVLAAASDLLGLDADRLWPDELAAADPEYPLVVALATLG